MLFSSVIFIFKFLPLALLIYFLLPHRLRNVFLLIISLLFYAWGEPVYIILMIASVIFNYFAGLLIQRSGQFEKRQKWILALGVTINLLLLIYYKYFGFIVDGLNVIFSSDWNVTPVVMPIGISFYTFHSLSYLIDVRRKRVKVQTNIINLGLYISFFPQLIAGPIVRYSDISEQISHRETDLRGFAYGIERFITGLAKKVLLANTLGEVADKIFILPHDEVTVLCSWLGIICYAFQILFDFSGYSDMAIGLGRMFGFKFLENFNFPYASRSIKDFWRRWHISLSTWFRDYLYIPLGGSRSGTVRTYINLLIVFFVTGLWHGASWNFIIWGLYYGVFLILERNRFGLWLDKLWKPIQHLYVILIVLVGWVFFRMETLKEAIYYLGSMTGFAKTEAYPFEAADFINQKIMICLLAAFAFSFPWPRVESMNRYNTVFLLRRILTASILLSLFILSMADIAADTYNPFIYFRF